MTRFQLDITPLDLDQTLGCGQTFRWRRAPDGAWRGPLGKNVYTIVRSGAAHTVESVSGGAEAKKRLTWYLRGADDVRAIQRTLGKDPVLKAGIGRMKGLRIVKIDEWECLASYILATYANIPRITKMIDTLCLRYGEPIDDEFHSFPGIETMREVPEKELRDCGLGYRAKLLSGTCRLITEDDLRAMVRAPSEELRSRLISLPGVGDKVADCVSLFGFGRLDSFPIDVWIERALGRLYGIEGSYRTLREFAARRFGPFAGYAQEYLYYNERVLARAGACVLSHE